MYTTYRFQWKVRIIAMLKVKLDDHRHPRYLNVCIIVILFLPVPAKIHRSQPRPIKG